MCHPKKKSNRLLAESSRVLEMWKEEGVAAQAVELEWAKAFTHILQPTSSNQHIP